MDTLHLICWLAFGVFALVQLGHTLADRNRWPFAAQNMFAHALPARVPRIMVALHDSHGGKRTVFPHDVLPIEFFRAQRLLGDVYFDSEDIELQSRFAEELLDRLNRRPWRAFGEIEAAARPPVGATFVGFDVLWVEYDIDRYVHGADLSSIEHSAEAVFSCSGDDEGESPGEPTAAEREA